MDSQQKSIKNVDTQFWLDAPSDWYKFPTKPLR